MGHIAVLCDDLQPRNGIAVSDDIVEYIWTILLDPSTNEFLLLAQHDEDVPGQFVWEI
jgi:hypothetical protein